MGNPKQINQPTKPIVQFRASVCVKNNNNRKENKNSSSNRARPYAANPYVCVVSFSKTMLCNVDK